MADHCVDILFYISGALSLLALLVEQKSYPSIYSWVQISFAISVVALFAVSVAVHLYFSPRAQARRYQDFLVHAFGKPLNYQQTTGYYNNSATAPSRRIAAQVLENSFYSADTLSQMAIIERIKIAVYLCLWIVVVVNRSTDLAAIAIAAQILFSEQVLLRILQRNCATNV